jgi:hypothetical protein
MIRRLTLLALLLVAGPTPAAGQPPLVRVSIHPQAEPVPALKYQLLPTLEEQQPGNAAVFYHRAMLIRSQLQVTPELDLKESAWLEVPLRDLPRADVRKAIEKYRNVFHEIDLAARRLRIDWELEFRSEGFGLLLPEVQGVRSLATPLALKARLEIAEGRYDRAIGTLRNGFAMARHVSRGPQVVQALVGFAVAQVMLRQVQDLIQLPGAPNLYWALTSLPRPLIELREALQGERASLLRQFPQLRRLLTERLTPEQVRKLVEEIAPKALDTGGPPPSRWERRAMIAFWTAKNYPAAKRFLREQGKSEQQVEAMPALQAVVIYALGQYRRLEDDFLKWYYVPYWQGRDAMRRTAAAGREQLAAEEALPLLYGLLPSFDKLYAFGPERDRRVAALRCIEALRLYAAAHGGALPASLKGVDVVPVPIDPATGKDFEYGVHDGKATLVAPVPSGEPANVYGLRYEITVAL